MSLSFVHRWQYPLEGKKEMHRVLYVISIVMYRYVCTRWFFNWISKPYCTRDCRFESK